MRKSFGVFQRRVSCFARPGGRVYVSAGALENPVMGRDVRRLARALGIDAEPVLVNVVAGVSEIRLRLKELGIEADITGRGKHLWSVYEKMVVKGREFDEIFDIVAVRVVLAQGQAEVAEQEDVLGQIETVLAATDEMESEPAWSRDGGTVEGW